MDNSMFAILGIGVCLFVFLAFLIILGDVYGGSWASIAQGVTPFFPLIVIFALGAFILVLWMMKK